MEGHSFILLLFFLYNAVSIPALIYGVTSWCIVKKFRNYRNYVCLNLMLAIMLENITILTFAFFPILAVSINLAIYDAILDYLMSARVHWLVVISHMFYVDFVKVLNGHIQRRYLISGVFGWVTPLVTTLIVKFLSGDILVMNGVLLLPFIINNLLFIINIVCLLRHSSDSSAPADSNKCRRMYIAILIFILSDFSLLSSIVMNYFSDNAPVSYFMNYLQPILLSIFVIIVKRNRELWYTFYVNKLKQRLWSRHEDHGINMQGRVIREPADTRPQVLDV